MLTARKLLDAPLMALQNFLIAVLIPVSWFLPDPFDWPLFFMCAGGFLALLPYNLVSFLRAFEKAAKESPDA